MQQIRAIGFDLFDTLVTVRHLGFEEALGRLLGSLQASGLPCADEAFVPLYRAAARRFMDAAHQDGQETHNRYWISAALQGLGYSVTAEDPRVALAVEAYFSAFVDYARPIPGALDMLTALHGRYRLGLLSNLTHAPAAGRIIDRLGMAPFFDVVLVSGHLGYRKPHPRVFQALIEQFNVPKEHTAFVGDNLEADIKGAQQVGIQPIWMNYSQSQKTLEAQGTSWQDFLTLLDIA
jgi:putative hydrolase of the HAD superfamily